METNWMTFVIPSIIAVFIGIMASFIRLKAAKKPVTLKKIVLPPLFMSTGFLMFLYIPAARPAQFQIMEALCIGAVFSIVLILTTKFEVRDGLIYVQRSKIFIFILIGLLLIRIVLRIVLGQDLNPEELSGMFYLMAYAMIIPWRVSMLITYLQLQKKMNAANSGS